MQSCSLSATGRYPAADALEVLQGDAASSALRLKHECLADPVIDVSPETSLSAGDLSELPLGCFRPLLLEIATTMGITTPHEFYLFTGIRASIGVCGEVDNPQVDSEEFGHLSLGFFFNLAGNKQEPFSSTSTNEIDLANTRLDHLALSLAALEWDFDTSFKRPDGNVLFSPTQKTRVVRLSSITAKPSRLVPLADLVSVGSLCNTTNYGLSTEAETLSHFTVDSLLNGALVEGLALNGLLRDPRARRVASFERRLELEILLISGEQSYLHSKMHACSVYNRSNWNASGEQPPFPPRAEPRGFHGRIR